MTSGIIYPADEVWEKAGGCAGHCTLIAENQDSDINICAGTDFSSTGKSVVIYAMRDGVVECEEETYSAKECKERVNEIYGLYLSKAPETKEADEAFHAEEQILEREEELDQAVIDFLCSVIGEKFYYYDADTFGDIVEECKDYFIEHIARDYGIDIFRPMYLEDVDTGEEYFTEYPYEDMVYEEKDSFLYK